MRRILLGALFSSLAIAILTQCSEKCPLEPCRPEEGRICGVVELPQGFPLSFKDLRVRTLAGSAGLDCNSNFSVPVLSVSSAHLIVAVTEDTVPVLLGCCLPEPEGCRVEGVTGAAAEDDLRNVIGSAEGQVLISAASTALALAMVNPIMSGTTESERFWFACGVVAHQGFSDLVGDVEDGLRSSPAAYLDSQTLPGIYTKVSRLVSDVVASINCGAACDTFGLAPYVDDAPGDAVALKNAAFVHYGAGVMDALADTLRAVVLLPGRRVSNLIQVPGPVRVEYDLGDACVDVNFYKGIAGVDEGLMLETGHPGGLATQANLSQAVWNALSVFDALPALESPHQVKIGDVEAVKRLAQIVRDGVPEDVPLTALYIASNYPEDVLGMLGPGVDPPDLVGFLASMRCVFMENTRGLVSEGLEEMDRFARDLITSPDFTSRCICQAGGEISECPDAPLLSAGGVEPDSGSTSTEFTFFVHYCDPLRDPPQFVRVGIDGEEYAMELLNGKPYDGVYHYATTLSPGSHNHYFRCADTTGATARFPATGPVESPFVGSPPVLSGRVEPGVGSTMTHFRYSLDCYDADGQVPVSVSLFIDGNAHDMNYVYSWENNHHYRFVTLLPAGEHDHFFYAEDVLGYVARLPEQGVYEGPSVSEYRPMLSNPSVSPTSGAWGERYTYEVDYYDPEGEDPYFVNVCYDGVCQNMSLKTGASGNGTYSRGISLTTSGWHSYYFICADSKLEEFARLPETGEFEGPFVEERPGGCRNWDSKIAVHVIEYDATMDCDEKLPIIETCADIQSTWNGSNVLAFPVFFDLCEYKGVEFGLSWPEWEVSGSWQSCADLSIGEISHPGEGVSQVWFDCHFESAVVPGWVWLFADSPGFVEPCGHPYTGKITIVNCWGQLDEPWAWGRAGVNGTEGDDPCNP